MIPTVTQYLRKNGKIKTDNYRSLAATPVGESVRIARVRHNDAELLRYLDKLGVRLKTIATVVEKAPFDGPLSFRVGPQRNAPIRTLGINVADNIMVEPISSAP